MKNRRDQDPLNVRMANLLSLLAMAAVVLIALLLFLASLFYTASIRADQYFGTLRVDLIPSNALVALAVFAALFLLVRLAGLLEVTRRFNRIVCGAALALVALLGFAWVFSLRAEPTHDAGMVYDALKFLRLGAPESVSFTDPANIYRYYFVSYPFQFGFFAYLDLIFAVVGHAHFLGALRGASVLLLVLTYYGLIRLTRLLFEDERVVLVTILLLVACVPLLLYCAAAYSLIPSLFACVWGIYFVTKYLLEHKWRILIPAALLLALAVLLKPNAWIVLVAVGIALLLDALKKASWRSLAAVGCIVLLALPGPGLAQRYYESETGATFGSGYPISSWAAMSLVQTDNTKGWYCNAFIEDLTKTCGEDMDAVAAYSETTIRERLAYFSEHPGECFDWYREKFATQWLEPTFQSIWSVNGGMQDMPRAKNALAEYVLGTSFAEGLSTYMRYELVLLYGGFLLGSALLLKWRSEARLILPLVLLGGVLYHLIFEAQSRYALSYLPLFAPVAAYGLIWIWPAGRRKKEAKTAVAEEANASEHTA
jgi:hypothetical protein